MDPARRRELTRYGAPAAFLLAVTIAVLLIKSGLDNGSKEQTVAAPTTTAHTTTSAAPTTTITLTGSATVDTTSAPANAQYYTIQSGDTLGAIASQYNTSVDQLLTWNPGLDPAGLQPGQRIRVG
ncbi:MAG TPA: LysM domain-containing protein [Gaiellaceae bacterium]|nr:LysM domain-containing protein [Gaiellaceae bacterium]